MPKKPSTVLVMKDYRPMSTRRWYMVIVAEVSLQGKGMVCFELLISDAPEQAGRRVVYRIPAVLAPDSPLHRFGIRLAEGEPLDLATLVGRVLRARFSKPGAAGAQDIAAVEQFDAAVNNRSPVPDAGAIQEANDGLG
jgi:hypothetical protein